VAFTPAVLHGLAADLLRRYATAFGGKRIFLDIARQEGLAPDKKLFVLRDEFDKFAKAP
jgi:hypothetical protein